jgi:hypothetical protein
MREFVMIVAAALVSAVAGAAFGALLAYLSPEFVFGVGFPREVGNPVRFASALGAVVGLFLGAATMAFALLVGLLHRRLNQ